MVVRCWYIALLSFPWNRSQDVEGSCFVALCRSIILPLVATPTKKLTWGGNEEKGQTDSRRHILPPAFACFCP